MKAGGEGDNRRQDGGWHHQFNGNEVGQTLEDGGQGSLERCGLWSHKESDTAEKLNDNKSPS